ETHAAERNLADQNHRSHQRRGQQLVRGQTPRGTHATDPKDVSGDGASGHEAQAHRDRSAIGSETDAGSLARADETRSADAGASERSPPAPAITKKECR